MPKPIIAQMLTDHITPLMKEHGWSQNQTRYWREWGDRNSQTIDFDEVRMPGPDSWFLINLGIDTYGHRASNAVHSPLNNPGDESAVLFQRGVFPAVEEEGRDGYWILRSDDALGPILANRLRDVWLPELDQWTDLPWIEMQLRTASDSPWFNATPHNAQKLIYVIAAQRDDPEIDELIDQLESLGATSRVIKRLRDRLQPNQGRPAPR